MADIAGADLFNAARGYEAWSDLDTEQKTAALARAGDYILAHYPIRAELDADGQLKLDTATYLLAREFKDAQPTLSASNQVKSERDKLNGLETETQYFEANGDAYPTITALLTPLSPSGGNSSSIIQGWVSL